MGQLIDFYPRPRLVRDSYYSLDGIWEFKITNNSKIPDVFDMSINVPYCVESKLSGINRRLDNGDVMYYRKEVSFNKSFIKDKTILHFDGVDQICNVYLNRKLVCTNDNGYLHFEIDISKYIKDNKIEIILEVIDDLDTNYPYGKQKKNRGGMWYTPVSGIWKSVWIESVSNDYIKDIKITPFVETSSVFFNIKSDSKVYDVIIRYDNDVIFRGSFKDNMFNIKINNPHLWSCDNPNLYDVVLKTKNDVINTYFAFRKMKINGNKIYLNDKPIFLHGVLDQGYFTSGIYTPGSYDDYKKDILMLKKFGFNTIRKHIKVEPEYFYYLCDKLGMIVMQDMINNGKYHFIIDTIFPTIGLRHANFLKINNKIQKEKFEKSMVRTMNLLNNYPCVLYYTIFNEGWGQHDAKKYFSIAKNIDTTRIIDTTSGWFKSPYSDVNSLHIYFKKVKIRKDNKPVILSEFGGYSLKIDDHLSTNKEYGYRKFKDKESLNKAILKLYLDEIANAIDNGLVGAIYTQTSDIEDEINGLVTYDRQIEKLEVDTAHKITKMIEERFYGKI